MCQVTAREGFILGEGAYEATRQSDMGKFGPSFVITIPFAGGGLKCVNVSGNFIFGGIEVNAGPRATLLDCVLKGYHALY
jgi:hypothetical protein